jgi:hypothetical protein
MFGPVQDSCYDCGMSTVSAYPHIVKVAGAPAHLESHPRTRVAMIVMDYLARGLTPEEIVAHYPYLTVAEVHGAMTYYYDHRTEVDAEIQAELQELNDAANPNAESPIWQKLKAKGLI